MLLMMMLVKVTTPPDAATVVVPPRSVGVGVPVQVERDRHVLVVPRLEVAVLVLDVERAAEGEALGGACSAARSSRTSCAGAAGLIVIEVEVPEVRSGFVADEVVGPDRVDLQVREGRDAVDRVDRQRADERAGLAGLQGERHRAVELGREVAVRVLGVDDHAVRLGGHRREVRARERRRGRLAARARERQLHGRIEVEAVGHHVAHRSRVVGGEDLDRLDAVGLVEQLGVERDREVAQAVGGVARVRGRDRIGRIEAGDEDRVGRDRSRPRR